MALSPLSLLDAFKWRHSVRKFLGHPVTPELKQVFANAIDTANAASTPFPERSVLRPGPPGLGGAGRQETGFLVPMIPVGLPSRERERASINAAFRGQLAVVELSRFRVPTVWLGIYRIWAANRLCPGFKSVVSICYGLGERPATRPGLLKRVLGNPRRSRSTNSFTMSRTSGHLRRTQRARNCSRGSGPSNGSRYR
jgi:hypothetical protein